MISDPRAIDAMADRHILIFSLAYLAMIPCANLVGFAGQELARKLPHVTGVLVEITYVCPEQDRYTLQQSAVGCSQLCSCGSVVEIVLFIVLLSKDYFYVIKAAVLGSILATMLLCLGLCFFVGGLHRVEQTFSEAISETGHGLLFTA